LSVLSDREIADKARHVIDADRRAVGGVAAAVDAEFVHVARLLSTTTGKVLITGSGTSGTIASRAAHLFSFCGTPAFYLPPADGLHGGLGVLQKNDIVLALSKFGSSDELNEFCRRARPLCSAIVAVTATANSPIAAAADHILAIALDADADLGGIVATGSSLAMAALIDALVEVTRVIRGTAWDAMLFTHPFGAVGAGATSATDTAAARSTKD
jgi:D-arabinose 5-phosphate isomerase GutQ